MSFGGHLQSLREGAGLSRPELARKAGLPVSTLRNWEGDRGFPGLPALERLARVLGVPVADFDCTISPAAEGPQRRKACPGVAAVPR
jgi:transcriptional regulator with XRE-family HTH domain